jgi:hypothetical protein
MHILTANRLPAKLGTSHVIFSVRKTFDLKAYERIAKLVGQLHSL